MSAESTKRHASRLRTWGSEVRTLPGAPHVETWIRRLVECAPIEDGRTRAAWDVVHVAITGTTYVAKIVSRIVELDGECVAFSPRPHRQVELTAAELLPLWRAIPREVAHA